MNSIAGSMSVSKASQQFSALRSQLSPHDTHRSTLTGHRAPQRGDLAQELLSVCPDHFCS